MYVFWTIHYNALKIYESENEQKTRPARCCRANRLLFNSVNNPMQNMLKTDQNRNEEKTKKNKAQRLMVFNRASYSLLNGV